MRELETWRTMYKSTRIVEVHGYCEIFWGTVWKLAEWGSKSKVSPEKNHRLWLVPQLSERFWILQKVGSTWRQIAGGRSLVASCLWPLFVSISSLSFLSGMAGRSSSIICYLCHDIMSKSMGLGKPSFKPLKPWTIINLSSCCSLGDFSHSYIS